MSIKTIRKQRDNTVKIAYAFVGFSFLSMHLAMSDTKYSTVDFCFIPEVLHSTPRESFCNSGKDVYRTSPKFLLKKDEFKPNPEFVTGTDKFLIPAAGRVIKNYNHATNPNYLWFSLASVLLSSTAYSLFSLTNARYKRTFPELFEQYKTETFQSQFSGQQDRETYKFKTTLETDYVQKGIAQKFQALEMFNMSDDEKFQYQLFLNEQHKKQKDIEDANYELQLSQIKAGKKALELDVKTAEAKIERLEKNGYEPGLENQNNNNTGQNSVENGLNNLNSFDVAKSEQETLETIKRLVRSDGSTVIVGQQGSGKSSFVKEYLRQVKAAYPEFEARIFSVKNDSYEGLREQGCCYRFIGDNKIEDAREFFQEIKDEYERRLALEESERIKLKPFIVILDDWISSAIALSNAGVEYGQLLLDILIIARQYNIKFVAILHSLNLQAIGLEKLDQYTRSCLNMVLLGNKYIEDGREMESYKVLESALNLPQAVPDKQDRENLKERYKVLKKVSQNLKQPVIFAYLGEYYLGIVPKF